MRRFKDQIKFILLKLYAGCVSYCDTSNDPAVVKIRNQLAQSGTRSLKGGNNSLKEIHYKLNLIMDYFIDPADARPATGVLLSLQEEIFDIMKIFKAIADKHDINYWVDYGTLLGAVRHGGFIPWDSDADVSILEQDVDKVTEILQNELPEEYEFVPVWLDRVYRIRKKGDQSQAFLDVYPYIVYGRDEEGNQKIRMKHGGDDPKVSWNRGHRPFPSSILFPTTTVDFRGLSFKAPHDIDSYLRLKYGNYHLLPKREHTEPGHPVLQDEIVYYPDDFPTNVK